MLSKIGPNIDLDFIPQHPDKGCALHPCCLECPEDECIEVVADNEKIEPHIIHNAPYLELIGRQIKCCLCGETTVIKNPNKDMHKLMWCHYGKGSRWFCNGLMKEGITVRFFVCPNCQGNKGENIALAWALARRKLHEVYQTAQEG